jgi:alginate O-acetyltransferase complex protein AlgI
MGLGKKVLIANVVAAPADQIFSIPTQHLTPGLAWTGAICYTLQIYFDFSGYSDMAIGLGHMFGFRFNENFNYPYVSRSITEFWRRWHISLSTWFRDYLYIPMGGNRCSPIRVYFNLFTVFFLCGLWHGASWNFIIWGMYHGLLLVLERIGRSRGVLRSRGIYRHLYVIPAFIIGWVFFRAETLPQALAFLRAMAGQASGAGQLYYPALYLNREILCAIGVGAVLALPILPALIKAYRERHGRLEGFSAQATEFAIGLAATGCLILVLLDSVIHMSASTYNPFIYFRF